MNPAGRTLVAAALTCAAGAVADAGPAGSVTSGESVYERCAACHSLGVDRTGPRHCGLFGRRAGSVKDFGYSEAMKRAGIVWNERTLDRFLENPLAPVPGTSMGYSGIADARERADLIAYLKAAGAAPPCTR